MRAIKFRIWDKDKKEMIHENMFEMDTHREKCG